MLDNCKGYEFIKKHKGSDMCQFCFIIFLKLRTMIIKIDAYRTVGPLIFFYILLAQLLFSFLTLKFTECLYSLVEVKKMIET